MSLSLLLVTLLTPITDVPHSVQTAMDAQAICQQFVQVHLGREGQPSEMKALPVPKKAGEWLVDGKVKGPEGPLLFACHLYQGTRWELRNFSLWAPQPIKQA
ncbi:MAG: hypothetical protein ACRC9N_03775 [Aeromonas sp.]